jgi:hypothetical protein
VCLTFVGTPSIYNSSGTLQGATVSTGYWYLKGNNMSATGMRGWSSATWSNGARLSVPFTGIYSIHFTFDSASLPAIFISKNLMNGADINDSSDNCLAVAYVAGPQQTISTTVHLYNTDYINFGFVVSSGSTTPAYRTRMSMYLIQKTG